MIELDAEQDKLLHQIVDAFRHGVGDSEDIPWDEFDEKVRRNRDIYLFGSVVEDSRRFWNCCMYGKRKSDIKLVEPQ